MGRTVLTKNKNKFTVHITTIAITYILNIFCNNKMNSFL